MLKVKRPRIGVTGPDKGGKVAWIFTALAIIINGGKPIRIKPSSYLPAKKLDGLILGGGADIDPEHYDQGNSFQNHLNEAISNKRISIFSRIFRFSKRLAYPLIFFIRKIYSRKGHIIDKERDKLELDLLDQAVKHELPVLGICRGAQLINIYFKGSLHKEIEPFYDEEVNQASILPVKKVTLKRGSKLFKIIGVRMLKVNALHHQAVKEAGRNIDIVAKEANGVVQAIESTVCDFMIGVQWHPEYLLNKPRHRRLFKALINKAIEIKTKKKPV